MFSNPACIKIPSHSSKFTHASFAKCITLLSLYFKSLVEL